jgi:CRP-like cAMP-binding protein
MISPEILRRYAFFGRLDDAQIKALAMLANEETYTVGHIVFEERAPAEVLYLLIEGSIDLSYKSAEEYHPKTTKIFPVGEVNPEEVFGISAVIEPYTYSATAKVAQRSRVIQFNAAAVRQLANDDCSFGYALMTQIARVTYERLAYTRVQLAAAWA